MSFVDRWIESMPDNYGPLPGADEEAVCLQGAEEGMVLLKNNGVLPLENKTVALFGAGAVDTIICGTGSGSIVAPYLINVEQGLTEDGFTLTSGRWLNRFAQLSRQANEKVEGEIFFKLWGGGTILIDEPEITEEELCDAQAASTAIYVIRRNTGEGYDRKNEKGDFLLSDTEFANLKRIAANFDHTVVILNTSVIDAGFVDGIPGIDAVVLMNLPGMMAGRALAHILTGRTTPCGRLADTWALRYADYPTAGYFSANDGATEEEDYCEDIYVGYRYFDSFGVEPRWCFGYGLSYTSFELCAQSVTADESTVSVCVHVKNTGTLPGREVVQVYVSAPQTEQLPKPYQELRGFAKTGLLAPGEGEDVRIVFSTASLASYDESIACFVLDPGRYLIRMGKNSRDTGVVGVLDLARRVVTHKLSPKAVCPKEFERLRAPTIIYENTDAPVIALNADAFTTQDLSDTGEKEIVTYVPEGAEYEPYAAKNPFQMRYPCPERVVRVRNVPDATLPDVYTHRTSMEEFVASLDEGVLLRLVTGVSHETPWPVPVRMKKKALPVDAIPSSGRTTAQYVESLGIPNSYLTDGPAGLHLFGKPTAAWPVGAVLAQTWDTALLEKTGDGFGVEMDAYRQDVLLGPGINIHRDPMGGRAFEYYSEDPLLSGKLAAAFTCGVQAHKGRFVAVKHFACNNQETGRGTSSSNVSQRALREIYLKGFEIVVREAEPGAIMTSYNKINGIHSSENRELLEDVVRGEWGYSGLFMTDWHSESCKPADLHAGNDLIMGGIQIEAIEDALLGRQPVFQPNGSVEEKRYVSYDGLKTDTVENWGVFLPHIDGMDTCEAVVAAQTALGERAQRSITDGVASLKENPDGSRSVVYRGTNRGRYLALGDLQRCAMHVLNYLLRTGAWQDVLKSIE